MHRNNVTAADETLVFGKNSNIGSEIVRVLLEEKLPVRAFGSAECDFLDRKGCAAFFNTLGRNPRAVIFLSVIPKSKRNDRAAFQDNVALVNNFMEAQAKISPRKIIYFSSVDVYGAFPPLPITEETRIDPDSWFGLAKYCCEWSLAHSDAVKCPVVRLRIPGVYGNPIGDKSAVGKFIEDSRDKGRIEIFGSGSVVRDYIHVRDVAKAVRVLIDSPFNGPLNLVTGKSHSLSEIVAIIQRVFPGRADAAYNPADPAREFDLKFDNSRLTALLPRLEFTDIARGIEMYACAATPCRELT